jgi:hypothetical protein
MDLANLVIDTGIEKDTLGGRCLTGVDVRRNTDVTVALNRSLAGHVYLPYLNQTAQPSQSRENGEAALKK